MLKIHRNVRWNAANDRKRVYSDFSHKTTKLFVLTMTMCSVTL